jgi:DNA-directed RNA polymerase subunit RPC12/RpoP
MPEAAMRCADCGEPVEESGNPSEREPCPNCGSTRRHHTRVLQEEFQAVDAISVVVVRAVNEVRLAVLAILLSIGAAAGFSAGFAEESVALGLAWGIGAIIVSVLLLAAILRIAWIRDKAMAAMYWVAGK